MAALTSARNTLQQGVSLYSRSVAMRAGAKVYQGGMVAIVDGYGLACAPTASKPGTGDGYLSVGIAQGTVDNTSGADAALFVVVNGGVFKMATGTSSNQVLQANVGQPCYFLDDQTVTPVVTAHSLAGTVWRIAEDGSVWVLLGQGSGMGQGTGA